MKSKNIIITIVIALIAGGAGFYGGMIYEKNTVDVQHTAARGGNGQLAGTNGQARGQRASGSNGNGGAFENGEITAKDDKSITLKTRDGSSKIIFFSDTTSVGKTIDGTAADLSVGQQVMVNGKVDTSGTITAQGIQIRPNQPNPQN
jgi:hypothetical protein